MSGQREMPSLSRLKRDNLWVHSGSLPQLEFVVDNETVAGLMNVEVRVENEFYEPMIAGMRQNLFVAFPGSFDYKGGYLSCHDWRPREYNKQADAVCNWVLDDCGNVEDLDVHDIVSRLRAGHVLQLYSDAGFDGTNGAASLVVICSEPVDNTWNATVCDYRGILTRDGRSAFQAELIAADAAISYSLKIALAMRP